MEDKKLSAKEKIVIGLVFLALFSVLGFFIVGMENLVHNFITPWVSEVLRHIENGVRALWYLTD